MPPRPLADQLTTGFGFDPIYEKVDEEAKQWARDPKARREINKELMEKGYDASRILEGALNRAAEHIDAIDRRIASYELRRMAERGASQTTSSRGSSPKPRNEAMTSDRKAASNRNNAQKSTGPRSEAGRWRSRRNAFRHGLAVAIGTDPSFSKDIEALATILASCGSGQSVGEFARQAAEAEVDLLRIRKLSPSYS